MDTDSTKLVPLSQLRSKSKGEANLDANSMVTVVAAAATAASTSTAVDSRRLLKKGEENDWFTHFPCLDLAEHMRKAYLHVLCSLSYLSDGWMRVLVTSTLEKESLELSVTELHKMCQPSTCRSGSTLVLKEAVFVKYLIKRMNELLWRPL